MAKVSVELEGFEELQERLSQLQLKPETRDRALIAGAEHLQSAIKEGAPVGLTGDLKESISIGEVSPDGQIQIGPARNGPDFRAHFPEFGTSKMKATPYMRPAYEREMKNVEKIMADETKKEMGI